MIKILNKIVELLALDGVTIQKGSPDLNTLQLDVPVYVMTSEQIEKTETLCNNSFNSTDIRILCASKNSRDYDEIYQNAMKIGDILYNSAKENQITIDNENLISFKQPLIKDLGTDQAGRFVIEVKAVMIWQYLTT